MTDSILIDTGFFVALSNKRDRHHHTALKLAEKYSEMNWTTTWPVLTEFWHLAPYHTAIALLKDHARGLFEIFALQENDLDYACSLMEKYNDKKQVDLADASLIIAAERIETNEILTVDQKDFERYRWGKNCKFKNLFF